MKVRLQLIAVACVLAVTLLAPVLGSTSAATAATSQSNSNLYPIDYVVKASTTLAKLNQTVTVPPGVFKGSLNLTTFVLRGTLTLPPASTTVSLAGLGLAKATFELAPTKEVTGKVNLNTLTVTSTASFNVLVTSVKPLGLPLNLVGSSCGTSKPVSVTFSGKFAFTGSSKFSGDYTIPPLKNCGPATTALNLVIPGPNNVFNASFAPAP